MATQEVGNGSHVWVPEEEQQVFEFDLEYDPVLDRTTALREVLDELEEQITTWVPGRSLIHGHVTVVDDYFTRSTT